MKRVAIVGATGYTGCEILHILLGHPEVEVTSLSAKLDGEIAISEEFPRFCGRTELACGPLDVRGVCERADCVFLALPHGVSMKFAPAFHAGGTMVIDLSADFRFSDCSVYEDWYGRAHEATELLAAAVYGMPELHLEEIRGATLIANPGCYPTGAILALAPLFQEKLVDPRSVIVDAKSGVTGAGRKASLALSFAECHESFRAYRVGCHPHAPEIEAELGNMAGEQVRILFTPHLVPMNRGILTTCYLAPLGKIVERDLLDLYRSFYARAPFVRVRAEGGLVDTKDVAQLNFCDISLRFDERTGKIVALSAIDNLVKGAAGQAVQNMNIACGFPETMGLV